MDVKEIKDALSEVTKTIEGKVDERIKAQADKDAATVKALGEEIAELKSQKDAQQKHLDELTAKQSEIKISGQKFADLVLDGLKAANIGSIKNNRSGSASFDVKAAATMTSANYSGGNVGLTSWDNEFARVVRRSPFLRQIVRTRPIGTQGISWAEQANPDPGAAGMTAEGAAKTQTDFDMVERREVSRKITDFIKVSKEALDDISYLASEINQELVELIELKLDEQILSGDNTGQNLKGILTYAPAFSVAGTSLATAGGGVDQANNFDVLRAAAWQIANSGKGKFLPNYILLNPIDAAKMDMTKLTDGQYVIPPFVSAGGQTVYGLRVIENVGVTAGDFLVGDFSKSVLGIREEITINIGYENDDFTKNLVTILGEMRAFHYIKTNHNTAFVKGTFSTAKAAMETA